MLWRRTNQRAARLKLLALDRAERIAVSHDALTDRTDLSSTMIGALRTTRRAQYERVTGVPLAERTAFRAVLEQVAETGEKTVETLVQEFRGGLRNGWVSGGSSSSLASSSERSG